VRVKHISAGPYASRAANVTGAIAAIVNFYEQNAPTPAQLTPENVAHSAVFLASPFASAITGTRSTSTTATTRWAKPWATAISNGS